MTKAEFYEILDIDSPEDFQYFENLAAFLECEDEPDYEDVAELVKEADKGTLAQLIGDYFEEIFPNWRAEHFCKGVCRGIGTDDGNACLYHGS